MFTKVDWKFLGLIMKINTDFYESVYNIIITWKISFISFLMPLYLF